MSKTAENKDSENIYAFDQSLNYVFVTNAKKGRSLYSCIGCKREVIRVRRESFWHFRHYVEKNSEEPKCTFRDETVRHRIAKDILQRLKKVKVPPIYKFSPTEPEALPKIIIATRVIEAHSVRNEVCFFETNDGELKWGKKEELSNMNNLIVADSVFFDKDNNPFLIIEFKATHGVDEQKKVKLKRLGIDAIQISIPKDSPEEIENTIIKNTTRTKWIYSYEEQITDYVSLPTLAENGIPTIDIKQRELFEEGYTCRKARINQLIFSLRKSMESERYIEVISDFESEINRVEGNTARDKNRLLKLQENIRRRVDSDYQKTIKEFESRRRKFEIEKTEFQDRLTDLEKRYKSRKSELEQEERIVDIKLRGMAQDEGGAREPIDFRKREIEHNIIKEEEDFRRISNELEHLSERFEEEERRVRREFEFFERSIQEEETNLEHKRTKLEREFREEEQRIESEFDSLREQSIKQFEKRDVGQDNRFSRTLKKAIENGGLLNNLKEVSIKLSRIRKAREHFKQGTYIHWNK